MRRSRRTNTEDMTAKPEGFRQTIGNYNLQNKTNNLAQHLQD